MENRRGGGSAEALWWLCDRVEQLSYVVSGALREAKREQTERACEVVANECKGEDESVSENKCVSEAVEVLERVVWGLSLVSSELRQGAQRVSRGEVKQ